MGKTTFEPSLNSLRPRGLLALFGQSSGPVPPINPIAFGAKGSLFMTRDEWLWRAGEVLGWVASGKLKPRIERAYPLAEAAVAHRDLEGRKTAGKLLLIP